MNMNPKQIFAKVRREKRKNLLEPEARMVLEHYKIPIPKWKVVKSAKEAVEFSEKIGYPVSLKIVSKDIIHKTDVGGVFLFLDNKKSVEDSFNQIKKNVKKHAPKAKIEGVIESKMIEQSHPVIVGGIKDSIFGSTIMVGHGDIFVELLDDVSFRVLPIDRKDAEEMMKETKVYQILKGYRGHPVDHNAVLDIMMKTAKMLEKNPEIKELDMNPIFVLKKGAYAVDARIILE
jgi:acetyl-CoA synthetase (ADP-forming)